MTIKDKAGDGDRRLEMDIGRDARLGSEAFALAAAEVMALPVAGLVGVAVAGAAVIGGTPSLTASDSIQAMTSCPAGTTLEALRKASSTAERLKRNTCGNITALA